MSKKGNNKHPLLQLFQYRNSLQSNAKETEIPSEISLMLKIPNMEKPQIMKLQDDIAKGIQAEDTVFQLKYNFIYDKMVVLELYSMPDKGKGLNDVSAALLSFHAIGWTFLDPLNRTTSDFETILELFNNSNPQNMRNSLNYAFERVLMTALAPKSEVEFTASIMKSIILQFFTNASLELSCFPLFVGFLQAVASSPDQSCLKESHIMLEQMILDKRKLILCDNIAPLIHYLQPFIQQLDILCLRILCLLTNLFNNQNLNDAFLILPSYVMEFVSNREKTNTMKEISLSESPLFPHLGSKAMNYIVKHDFDNGLFRIPYELVNTKMEITHYLPTKVNDKAYDFGEAIFMAKEKLQIMFFQSFLSLSNSTKDIDLFCSLITFFFLLIQKRVTSSLLKQIQQLITSTVLFSPHYTIFLENGLYEWINTLRTFYFQLLMQIDQQLIVSFLPIFEAYPLVFTEYFIRILDSSDVFDMNLLNNPKIMKLLSESALRLQNLSVFNITIVRSANFGVIFEILSNDTLSHAYFTNEVFVNNFLILVFESDMSDVVLQILRNSLTKMNRDDDLSPIVDFMAKAIYFCKDHVDQEAYIKLAKSISHNLIEALRHQVSICLSFLPLINPFIQFILVSPDSSVLKNMLMLITLIALNDNEFEFSRELLHQMIMSIKKVDGTEPSTSTTKYLLCLLSGSLESGISSRYYIRVPSALPLVLSSFGESSKLPSLLEHFIDLCNYASVNRRFMHEGDIDLILLKVLVTKSIKSIVSYKSIQLPFELSYDLQRKLLIPLIESILFVKSSNAIASLLSNFISCNVEEYVASYSNTFISLLEKCSSAPRPVFPLDTSESLNFDVRGLFSNDLNSGFSVVLKMNLDVTPLITSNASITLFTIIDYDNNLLRVFISGNKIYAKYESGCTRTSVHLVRSIPPQEWVMYSFVFSFKEEKVRVSSYQNEEMLNDSDLCSFVFSNGEVEFSVGGLDTPGENEWSGVEMGSFGGFSLYNMMICQKDVSTLLKRPWESSLKPMFSSEIINQSSSNTVYSIPRLDPVSGGIFSSSVKDIVITANSIRTSSKSIIDNLIDGGHCNRLSNFFLQDCTIPYYPSFILTVLNLIFKRSVIGQEEFDGTKTILKGIYKRPTLLKASLYFSIIDVFDSISFPHLQTEWFEKLIINVWLWSKAEPIEFKSILNHWSHDLIVSHYSFFLKKSYFSFLFNAFKVLFCFNPDINHSDDTLASQLMPEISLTSGSPFNDSYSIRDVYQCRAIFKLFIQRVSFLILTDEDISLLFIHITSCQSKQTIIELINIITSLSPVLQNRVSFEQSTRIHSFIGQNDYTILEHVLITIHELKREDIVSQSISMALEISKFYNQQSVYEIVFNCFKKYPALIHLLIILSIRLGGEFIDRTSNLIKEYIFEPITFWFLWPIILSLSCGGIIRTNIIQSICKSLLSSNSRIIVFNQMICLIYYLSALLPEDSQTPLIKEFLINICGYISSNTIDIIPCLVIEVFNNIFFRFYNKKNSPSLLDSFKLSPFGTYIDTTLIRPPFINSIKDINDVQKILLFDYSTLSQGFQICINQNAEWADEDLANALINTNYRQSYDPKLVMHYYERILYLKSKNMVSNSILVLSQTSLTYFDEKLLQCNIRYQDSIKNIITSLRSLFDVAQKCYHESQSPDISEKQQQSILKMQAAVESIVDMISLYSEKREALQFDKAICRYFCSPKMKTKASRYRPSLPNPSEIITEYTAQLLSIEAIRDCKIKLLKDRIVIVGSFASKVLLFSSIYYIFIKSRKGKDSLLEIYMTDGRSYLIDTCPHDPTMIMKSIPKQSLTSLKSLIPSRPIDIFGSLPYMNKWANGCLSNFSYLMKLNIISGRSFKDKSLYPIFPSVLSNFFTNMQIKDIVSTFDMHFVNNSSTIESLFVSQGPIKPETYFSFIHFSDPEGLPSWASNIYELVYEHRKVLETKHVSAQLSSWIDLVWGVKYKNQVNGHKVLFSKPHPQFKKVQSIINKVSNQSIDFGSDSIIYSSFSKIINSECIALIITNNGNYSTISISIENDIKCRALSSAQSLSVCSKSTFVSSVYGSLLYSRKEGNVHIFRSGKLLSKYSLQSTTKIFAMCKYGFVYCPDPCTISFFDDRQKIPTPELMFRSDCSISCVAMSNKYKVLAYSTTEGVIHVINTSTKKLVNSASINRAANMMVITEKWGFIVALTLDSIFVFSINGFLIKEVDILCPITAVFPFYSTKGFDYLGYCNSEGRIGFFEVMKPNNFIDFYEVKEGISTLAYDNVSGAFLLITNSSQIKTAIHPVE